MGAEGAEYNGGREQCTVGARERHPVAVRRGRKPCTWDGGVEYKKVRSSAHGRGSSSHGGGSSEQGSGSSAYGEGAEYKGE